MKDPILKNLIVSNRAEQVQRYVKNYLPNNPQKLQRIYLDLATLNDAIHDIIQGKTKIQNEQKHNKMDKALNTGKNAATMKRYLSQNQLSSKKLKHDDYFQRNKQQNITKRHQALIRNLKSKGLRGNSDQIPLGIAIAQKQDKRISKPLQINRKIDKNERDQSPIKKSLKRFNLNTDFYSNTVKDGYIDEEKYYDREMKMFLQTRAASLKKINAREEFQNQIKHVNSKRYSHVGSILSTKINNAKGYETLKSQSNLEIGILSPQKKQRLKRSEQFSNRKLNEAQQLINSCKDEIKSQIEDNRPKSLLSQSKNYQKLRTQSQSISKTMRQIKQRLEFDGMELQNSSLEIGQTAKQYSSKNLIDKYTLSYIKAIMNRNSNQNFMANKKDLLRNELNFRRIFADK